MAHFDDLIEKKGEFREQANSVNHVRQRSKLSYQYATIKFSPNVNITFGYALNNLEYFRTNYSWNKKENHIIGFKHKGKNI